jgi:hypothetical protein
MKGIVKDFDDELRKICAEKCADVGDPPCWKLPDMTSDCDDEIIEPCLECLKDWVSQ